MPVSSAKGNSLNTTGIIGIQSPVDIVQTSGSLSEITDEIVSLILIYVINYVWHITMLHSKDDSVHQELFMTTIRHKHENIQIPSLIQ